jgi:hypothetical protein
VTVPSWLALGAVAAYAAAFLVARFSRWWFLSPWVTVCWAAGSVLVTASAADSGHWLFCLAWALPVFAQGKFAMATARVRHRITGCDGETGAEHG